MNALLIHLLLLPFTRTDIEASIVYIDAKNNFVVVDKGKKDGLGADFDYDVVRKMPDGTTAVVGRGSFEKFLGRDAMAKLKVDDGSVGKMQNGDRVICRRRG
jgi:hypothetical protein